MGQRLTLAHALRRRLLAGVALMFVALNALLAFVAHHQIHQQTDALLLELATLEGRLNLAEPDRPHVHGGLIGVPTWGQQFTHKYALIYNRDCEVISATPQLQALSKVPAAWCERGSGQSFFTEADSGYDLRVGTYKTTLPGFGELTFMVGIAHESLDRSMWLVVGTGALGSMLALLVLWGLIALAAREVTSELERLRRSCEGLEVGDGGELERLRRADFALSSKATVELTTLSTTLAGLVSRLYGVLQAQGRFVAVAAHELRTPLTALRGEIEVTLRRERAVPEYVEALNYLLADVDRLQSLAESLLHAARADVPLELGPVMLNDALALATEVNVFALEQAQIELEIVGDWDVAALGDERGLVQLMSNLLANAAAHSQATHLKVALEPAERTWIIWIEDDGVGIDEATFSQVFAPFQRGDQSAGHGLGLYIAQRLASAQRGSLNLVPSARGARWRIELQRLT